MRITVCRENTIAGLEGYSPVSTVCVDGGIMQVSFLQSVDVGKKFALYITYLTESESVTEWPVTPRDF